jgi:hypothetical protein
MNKLKALLRLDPMTGAICAIIILACTAFDTSMLATDPSQPDPNCPMWQAVQAGTYVPPPQDGGGSGGTGCVPLECICPVACGLCKP